MMHRAGLKSTDRKAKEYELTLGNYGRTRGLKQAQHLCKLKLTPAEK